MTPAPVAPAPAPKKKGGCLRSCLVLVIVLAVLTVFGVGAWKRWLRPELASRVTKAQEESPFLAWGAEQLGLTNPFEDTPEAADRPGGKKDGTGGRAQLPPDIALAEDPLAEAVNVGKEHVTVFQRVGESPAAAAASHALAMERFGWKVTRTKKGAGAQVVSARPGLGCVLNAVSVPAGAELFLRCGGVAPEPDAGSTVR